MIFSSITLSSCANRIPSMYMDVNAPKPQMGDASQYSELEDEVEQSNEEHYSSLTGNVNSTSSLHSSKTLSIKPVSSPTMYSSNISSRPSSKPSSNPEASITDPDKIPTTGSAGTEVKLDDDLSSNIMDLLNYDYNITGSFENDTDSKDVQMSIVVMICENKLKTDAEDNVKYFTKEDIETTYKNYFGTELSDPSALLPASGVKYINGRYELVNDIQKTTNTKYIRSTLSLGNGYYKVLADIRSNGSIVASATYVVKVNTASPYGVNLIAQKIIKY